MRAIKSFAYTMIAASSIVTSVIANAHDVNSVKNKTYSVWVSQSFSTSPFEPFHECFRFTHTQLCVLGCGGSCGPLSEIPSAGLWEASVPCQGLNLKFKGTSYNGPDTSVIGASVIGYTEQTNFAAEGIKDHSCYQTNTRASERASKSPYAK